MSDFLAGLFDLTGKVALVTGARSGLGPAMALTLASAGADIAGLGCSPMPETVGLPAECEFFDFAGWRRSG